VLLVEPDLDMQERVRAELEERDIQVWTATDGSSGLALAREHLPGAIVGDFPMDVPGESPFTSAVRKDERLRGVIIITVTGRNLTEKDSPAWMNSDRVLSKPIAPDRLADEIAWALDRPSAPSGL
jgi:CheY-like chemotaxis protein